MAYDPDADRVLIWANTDPQSGYFYQKDGVRSGLITGIMSCWQVDLEIYDGIEYRDELGGVLAGPLTLEGSPLEFLTLQDPPTTDPAVTITVPENTQTGSDPAMHIPPRPTLHKETYLQFWDDAGATGSVVYQVPARLRPVFEVSEQPFTYVS